MSEKCTAGGAGDAARVTAKPILLVVSHSRTGSTTRLVDAARVAARTVEDIEVRSVDALEATPADVLAAAGYLLATPENFGSMSGAMKYFLETIFHPCEAHTRGRPYALVVKGGEDGTGAVESVQRIVAGLGWRLVQPPLVVLDTDVDALEAAAEVGGALAAGISLAH